MPEETPLQKAIRLAKEGEKKAQPSSSSSQYKDMSYEEYEAARTSGVKKKVETIPVQEPVSAPGGQTTSSPAPLSSGGLLQVNQPTDFNFAQSSNPELYQTELDKDAQQSARLGELNTVYDTAQGEGAAITNLSQANNRQADEFSKPLTAMQSTVNSFKNAAKTLELTIPKLQVASADIWEYALGKEMAKKAYQYMGQDIDKTRTEAFQELDNLSGELKATLGLADSIGGGDVPGMLAGVVNAVSQVGSTAVSSILSGGATLFTDQIGQSITDYNKEKAKQLDISLDDLYKQGLNDFETPAVLGALAGYLDRVGLKGINNAMTKQFTGTGLKKAALFFTEINKEGVTELLQEGVGAANKSIGAGESAEEAGKKAVSAMFSKQGLEAYLQGLIGSAGVSGAGRMLGFADSNEAKKTISKAIENIGLAETTLQDPNATPEAIAEAQQVTNQSISSIAEAIDNEDKQTATEVKSEVQKQDLSETVEAAADATESLTDRLADATTAEEIAKIKSEAVQAGNVGIEAAQKLEEQTNKEVATETAAPIRQEGDPVSFKDSQGNEKTGVIKEILDNGQAVVGLSEDGIYAEETITLDKTEEAPFPSIENNPEIAMAVQENQVAQEIAQTEEIAPQLTPDITPESAAPVTIENEFDGRPAEDLATMYADEVRSPSLSAKDAAIASMPFKINRESYANFGDRNNITASKARSYFAKDGLSVDQVAQEINNSQFEGREEVTPDDIINFIDTYQNGPSTVTQPSGNPRLQAINDAYFEQTGKKLNQRTAAQIAASARENIAQVDEQTTTELDPETMNFIEDEGINLENIDQIEDQLGWIFGDEMEAAVVFDNIREYLSENPETTETVVDEKTQKEVNHIFETTPELGKIGSQKEYAEYLNTIFPNSKVKEILFRLTQKGLDKLPASEETGGIYASSYLKEVSQYYGRRPRSESDIYRIVVNLENPKAYEKQWSSSDTRHTKVFDAKEEGHDGLTVRGRDGEVNQEVAVLDSDQVHILGSKSDIENFRQFKNKLDENANNKSGKPSTVSKGSGQANNVSGESTATEGQEGSTRTDLAEDKVIDIDGKETDLEETTPNQDAKIIVDALADPVSQNKIAKPSKIDSYSANIVDNGKFYPQKSYQDGASLYELEKNTDGTYNVYISSRPDLYGMMLNNKSDTILNLFDEKGGDPKSAKQINTSKPAVISVEDGKTKIISKGDVTYDSDKVIDKAFFNPISEIQKAVDRLENKFTEKLMPKITDAIAEKLKAWRAGKSVAKQMASSFASSVMGGIARTDKDTNMKLGLIGGKNMAVHNMGKIMKSLYSIVNNNTESLERVHVVLDPEFYQNTGQSNMFNPNVPPDLKYDDLTDDEKTLYDQVRKNLDDIHFKNHVLGFISKDTFDKHKGTYVPRMYETFELPAEVQEDLDRYQDQVGGKLNLNPFKKKKALDDLSDDSKNAILKDPVYLMAKRMMELDTNSAVMTYINHINRDNKNMVYEGNKPPFNYQKLEGKAYGALDGKYVPSFVAEDLRGYFFVNKSLNNMYDVIKGYDRTWARQAVKKGLTVFNPFVQLGNFTSNVVFAQMSGIDFARWFANTGTAIKSLKAKDQDYEDLLAAGLVGSDTLAKDLRPNTQKANSLVQTAQAKKDQSLMRKVLAPLQKVNDAAMNLYSGNDDYAKINAYQIFKEQGYSKEEALKKVYDGFQNYATVGKFWDVAAKTPVFGNPFQKFSADLARITTNAVTKKPLSTSLYVAGLYMMPQILKEMGISDDDEDELEKELREGRPFIPKMDLGVVNVPLVYKTKIGELNLARYITPYYFFDNGEDGALSSMASRFNPYKSVVSQGYGKGNESARPFGQDPVLGTLYNIMMDTDFRGKSIQDPEATRFRASGITDEQKWTNRATNALRTWIPNGSLMHDTYLNAKYGEDFYGRSRSIGQTLINFAVKIQDFPDSEYKKTAEKQVYSLVNDVKSQNETIKNTYVNDARKRQRLDESFKEGKISNSDLQNNLDKLDSELEDRILKATKQQAELQKKLVDFTTKYERIIKE